MGDPKAFMNLCREMPSHRPVMERLADWKDVYDYTSFPAEKLQQQASRCMDCGIPFCQKGCPLGNIIPEFNHRAYLRNWEEALQILLQTNPFPEFTGRICPAPCEEACVLGINSNPVTIKLVERALSDRGFNEGWLKPRPPKYRTGKKVAVIGSGPAGLAAAMLLNQAGHLVSVFERDDRVGGLLTYGIPFFKLEKDVVNRRVTMMEEEGIRFCLCCNVGNNTQIEQLRREFDAILLCCGATQARDLSVPGRNLSGIYLAMEYLTEQSRVNFGSNPRASISAKGKNVIILGGGDTGADCLGTALRQGAKSVKQFELLPKPPTSRTAKMPWPTWPIILRTSSSHEEGGERDWSILTKSFNGEKGNVEKLHAVRLKWSEDENGRLSMVEIEGSEFVIECDLVLLALGFVHPEQKGPIETLGLEVDERKNLKVGEDFSTSTPGVFAAGDMHRGQSLVVWAIAEGRDCAKAVDRFLMGFSDL